MKASRLCSILLTLAVLWACEDTYTPMTRTISLPSFASVSIKSVFTIYLVQDTVYAVRVVADDDAVDHIEAIVTGDVLTLTDNSKQKWLRPKSNKVTLYLHSPAHGLVNAVVDYTLYSSNVITSNVSVVNEPEVKFSEIDLTLNCATFSYWNNYLCNGRLTLRGSCGNFDINNFALHEVNTVDLDAQTGFLNHSGRTDCKVYVRNQLRCNLNGPGNIYVHGNPTEVIIEEQTSTGQLIRVN